MSRGHSPLPRTQQLRDQIVMTLRDAGAPLSTSALAAKHLPPREERWRIPCSRVCIGGTINGHPVVACEYEGDDIVHTVVAPAYSYLIYPHLQALEKAGWVHRQRGRHGDPRVYWSYAGDDALQIAREIRDLDTLWEAPVAGDHDRRVAE